MNNNAKKLEGVRLYMVMVGMLVAGTANTILTKWQNSQIGVPEVQKFGDEPRPIERFTHPYVQSANMFIGEMLCLGMYGIKLLLQRRNQLKGQPEPMSPGTQAAGVMQLKTDINPLLLAIPAAFDLVGSSLMNVALTLIPASIYQMLRGMIIIVTSVMSIIFLNRKLFRHHWASAAVIFTGILLVGLAALLASKNSDEPMNPLGLVLLVLAQLFSGGLYIVEEKLLGDYYLDPLKVVGLEGLWGFLMTLVILPIFQVINCGPNELCYYGKLEDTTRAFADFSANKTIILQSVLICFSIASFNAFGVTVTKNASSAQRSTIDTSRTALIWIFFMTFDIGVPMEHFTFLQLTGFILLVLGTLVYNEIIIVPIWGFDKNTKAAKEKRSKRALLESTATEEGATGYVAVSPHAAYDAARNQRKVAMKVDQLANAANRLEGGLNKSEITVEETTHKSHLSYSSAPTYNKD